VSVIERLSARGRVRYGRFHCISSDLSWSNHINSICAKAKRILGLLYKQYCNHVEGDFLKLLYISLVRPHMEYGCAVWDPYILKDKRNFEQGPKTCM